MHGSSWALHLAQVLPCTPDTNLGSCGRAGAPRALQQVASQACSGCVNREGGVCTSEYICGVGGYRLSCGRAAARMFYCCCHNYIWKTREKKNNKPTAVVRPKELQLNFIFQLLKHGWIVSVVRNKVRSFVSVDGRWPRDEWIAQF